MLILLELLDCPLRAFEKLLAGTYALPPPQKGFLNYRFGIGRDAT
jgi:hypothetical protein